MNNKIKILHLEDSINDSELIRSLIDKGGIGYDYFLADNEKDYLRILETEKIDIILSDYNLPDYNGNEALKIAREKYSHIPFIFVSGTMGEDIAIDSLLNGATDYVLKNKLERLVPAINRAIHERDIERKQQKAEDDLIESEERFRTLYENSTIGLYRTTPGGNILLANPTLVNMLGYSSFEELSAKDLEKERFAPLYPRSLFISLLEKEGEVKGLESSWKRKDGSAIVVRESSRAIKDSKGKILYYDGTVEDITERKKAESVLQEIISKNPMSIQIVDKNGYTISVNSAHTKLFGSVPPPEFTIFNDSQLEKQGYKELFERVKKGEIVHFPDTYYNAHDFNPEFPDVPVWLRGVIFPLMDTSGNPEQFVLMQEDITERRKAKEELFKISHRQETILATVPEIIMEVDNNKIYTWINEAGKEFFGEDVIGKEASYYFEGEQETYKIVQPLFNGSEDVIYVESWQRRIDGEKRLLAWWCKVTKDAIGNVIGSLSTARDITEQKKAEEALKVSEEKYRVLFQTMNDGVIQVDIEDRIQFVNKSICNMFGYKQEELIGKIGHETIIDEEDKEIVRQKNRFRLLGHTDRYEVRGVKKSGEKIWLNISGSPIINYDGMITGSVGILSDITENKHAEEELKKSEEKFRSLVENMPEGFYQSTPEGRFLDVNPAFVKMLGYDSKEELMKVHIPTELYVKEEERTSDTDLNPDFTDEFEVYRLKRKDGTEIWLEDFSRYIKDEKGKVIIHEGICRDITSRKHADDEMIKAKELAEESNRLKSSFLANMSHELRTPMVGILGFSEIILHDAGNEQLEEMAGMLNTSAQRLMDTLNLILDISSIEAGKLKVVYEYIDIIKVVKESVNLFEPQANKKNLYIKFESKEDSFVSRIDERLVRQIANNLVNNAIKFTEKGGVTVEISKAKSDGMEYSILKIKDTGIGIPENFLKIIFEEFRQVSEGHSRDYEGTGLGLSITKKFVDTLKGEISVESEPGSGTTITVKFPVEPDEFSPKIKSNGRSGEGNINVEPFPSEKKQKKTINVLCVDDDKDSLFFAKKYLTGICAVDIVDNGIEAIRLAKKKKYPLIIMDINLKSGMDGVEITRKIREIKGYEKTPVIAVTAFAMKGDKEKYLGLGFDEYLSKPYKADDIISVVKKTMKTISN